jgi:hypothetical protein
MSLTKLLLAAHRLLKTLGVYQRLADKLSREIQEHVLNPSQDAKDQSPKRNGDTTPPGPTTPLR